jgi:hypothetical protein
MMRKCQCTDPETRDAVIELEYDWIEHARRRKVLTRYAWLVASGLKCTWGLCPRCDRKLREQVLSLMFQSPLIH